MIRLRKGVTLLGAALLAAGCVDGDAPRAGMPATPAAEVQEAAKTAKVIVVPERTPTREADASPPEPAIVETLTANPDPGQRREAVYALADVDPRDSAATLGEALYDPDARVRESAVEAMTGIEDDTAADWLSVGLGDPEPRVRRAAVEALGQVGGENARFLLQQALGDADAGVREAAAQMLSEPEFAQGTVR